MKALELVCCIVLVVAAGCSKKTEQQARPGENPLTAPADYLGVAAQAKIQAEKTIDLAAVNQAIRMFYTSEGRFPNSLQELVDTGYLPVVPQPPAGMKLNYDPKTGTATMTKLQ
jgi:hypothetical protein